MNKSNNKRKKDSQTRIELIFLELIQTKDINKISVTDICKRAKLNRSTFYSSYLDVYDLADKIGEKLEKEVADLYSESQYGINDFLKLFKHIKDNQIFYKTYFKLGFHDNFIIKDYDYDLAFKYYKESNIEYHIEFFRAGINAIILKWLNEGCKESPEAMVEILKSEYKKNIV